MTPGLLELLCDPGDGSALTLIDPVYDDNGTIQEGILRSTSGNDFPIRVGVPRFVDNADLQETVEAFGDQWNFFNFEYKENWLSHTVRNTFGDPEFFRDRIIVDAGAGSGMQSLWMSEAGARHVIALELSHTVDGILRENLKNRANIDIIQCSIAQPPLKIGAINGIVICHNVIQHTPSVEDTARALWRITGENGEFVFNCYKKDAPGLLRDLRFALFGALRSDMARRSFRTRLAYAKTVSILRFLPVVGLILEKANLMSRGEIPPGEHYLKRAYQLGVLNTFDFFGGHAYQHYKSDDEIRALIAELQPDASKIANQDAYFARPQPIGAALRLRK